MDSDVTMASESTSQQELETVGCHTTGHASSNLCEKCQYVFTQFKYGKRSAGFIDVPFYEDSSLMHLSAEKGCLLCGQFLALIESNQLKDPVSIVHSAVDWDGHYLGVRDMDKHRGLTILFIPEQSK